jgi:hypothetical protein
MTFSAEHIERIKELGYKDAEARFLYIVAVYSGYFTLGQFQAFTNTKSGSGPSSFAQKVVKRGHATVRDYMHRGSIFHLFSRTFYSRIEKEGLRHGPRRSFDFIRLRLVLLDFILANQEWTYLDTEQDKIRFFCEELGISKDCLPMKVYEGGRHPRRTLRYFIDKFPIFLAPPILGADPVVTLTYIDAGLVTPSNFTAHLLAYRGLFRELKCFKFLYIAANDAYFQRAGDRFRSVVKTPLESDISSEVLRYFKIRRKWEQHEYVVPVTEDLEFLKGARRRFDGDRFEALYRSWETGSVGERELLLEFSELRPNQHIFFDTFLVKLHGSPLAETLRRVDAKCLGGQPAARTTKW